MRINKQAGVTLIELTVVLLILVALAGVTIPYMSGTSSAALCRATDVTMQNVKKVIMERYYLDTLGQFPVSKTAGIVGSDYNLKYLFNAGGWNLFDPATQTGWRQGGYLQNGVQLSTNPNSSFQDNTKVHDNIVAGQNQVLDGWGRPIVLQVNCDSLAGVQNCARLVSAGQYISSITGKVEIDTNIGANRPSDSDDRILYLNSPTPATDVNPTCDE